VTSHRKKYEFYSKSANEGSRFSVTIVVAQGGKDLQTVHLFVSYEKNRPSDVN